MTPRTFDRAAAEARLGAVAVEAARRVVDEAPALGPEQRAKLRAVFASSPARRAAGEAA